MKKKVFSLALVTLVMGMGYGQDNKELNDLFEKEQARKESLFNQLQAKSSHSINSDVSKLAEISNDYLWFLEEEDIRANAASNVDNIQNGEVGGFALTGENMQIAIFDGGKVKETHRDFRISATDSGNRIVDLENGAQALSSHATSVAGFIAAEGVGASLGIQNVAKGVLPKAVVKHAGFASTTNGSVFQKIVNYNEPISNHSYGVNSGWSYKTTADGYATAGWYFPNNIQSMTSPDQTFFGAYQSNDYQYDLIVNNNPKFTIVKSSGNYFGDGPSETNTYPIFKYSNGSYVPFEEGDLIPNQNCSTGAYCIGTGSLAKNIIVVGAVNLPAKANNYKVLQVSDVVKSGYSSVGPRKDGAIKPDLVAVGTSVVSPNSANTTGYTTGSGTSFSAPKVTGVVGSITQLKRLLTNDTTFNFYADEVKAILTHTAMEAGEFDGPDNWFGWGMLDALKAAQTVLATHNNEEILERKAKVSGTNDEKIITAREGEEIKATITWIDPTKPTLVTTSAVNILTNTDSKLVNDLDLRIIDMETNEVHLPWKLDLANVTGAAVKGDNVVDNIEQVLIKNPVAGRNYKIVVSNKGNLVNKNLVAGNQDYVLLVTGADSESLSTSDVTSKAKIEVYPTIAKEIVNVKSKAKIIAVNLIDVTGRLISTTKTDKVNVSSLSSGVYLINVITEEGTVTKKIVKQ